MVQVRHRLGRWGTVEQEPGGLKKRRGVALPLGQEKKKSQPKVACRPTGACVLWQDYTAPVPLLLDGQTDLPALSLALADPAGRLPAVKRLDKSDAKPIVDKKTDMYADRDSMASKKPWKAERHKREKRTACVGPPHQEVTRMAVQYREWVGRFSFLAHV